MRTTIMIHDRNSKIKTEILRTGENIFGTLDYCSEDLNTNCSIFFESTTSIDHLIEKLQQLKLDLEQVLETQEQPSE